MAGAKGEKRGKAKAGAAGVDARQGEGRGQRQGGELRLKRGEAAAKAEPGTRRGAMIFFRGAVRCGLGQGREQGAAGRGPVLHGGVLGEGMEELTWGGCRGCRGGRRKVPVVCWRSPERHEGVVGRHTTEADKREKCVSSRVDARAWARRACVTE